MLLINLLFCFIKLVTLSNFQRGDIVVSLVVIWRWFTKSAIKCLLCDIMRGTSLSFYCIFIFLITYSSFYCFSSTISKFYLFHSWIPWPISPWKGLWVRQNKLISWIAWEVQIANAKYGISILFFISLFIFSLKNKNKILMNITVPINDAKDEPHQ